jgi:hypothetical protein
VAPFEPKSGSLSFTELDSNVEGESEKVDKDRKLRKQKKAKQIRKRNMHH